MAGTYELRGGELRVTNEKGVVIPIAMSKIKMSLEDFIKEHKLIPAKTQIEQDKRSKETMKKEKEQVIQKRKLEVIKPKEKGTVEYKPEEIKEKKSLKERFTPKPEKTPAQKLKDNLNKGMKKKIKKKKGWGEQEMENVKKKKRTLDEFLNAK